ncbi:MAG: tRNA (adenosine(37)-N6)-dimethylallyltransferase MiaA [Eubacteriales bacterium]|nr:tRNA (adenosine(37)-N6)-dimethylallyltransferase MiaA [Eubacteriales bacterium]
MDNKPDNRPLLAAFVGPTASGKSTLAMEVAEALNGTVVCMDAMQVYRGMDIGTAKPSREDQARVPHRMLDVAAPDEPYSVAAYVKDARGSIGEVLSQGRLPLLTGGTGLYLRALRQPLTFGHTPGDEAIRAHWQRLAEAEGAQAVHGKLLEADPVSARRLHPNDLRRVIRALEVFELTGRPFSAQEMPGEDESPYRFALFGVSWEREILYARIDQRVDRMLEAGLAEEVRMLLASGVSPDSQAMQGLGYKELVPFIRSGAGFKEAMETIKRRTRNYAKRQMTWFNREPDIHWFTGGEDATGLANQAISIIKEIQ